MKLAVVVVIIIFVFCIYYCMNSIENYRGGRRGGRYHRLRHGHRHGRWWGRHGGRYGGWGYWGVPYYSGIYTSWPPYLYDYSYHYPSVYSSPRCITSNEASDCEPNRPIKIGSDLDDDGVKDTWKCCRRY